MRFAAPLLLLALCLTPLATAQSANQDLRLRVVSNDASDGGTLTVALELRVDPSRAPNVTFGSATVEVKFDAANLTPSGATDPFGDGYTATIGGGPCVDEPGTCARLEVSGGGIGPGGFGSFQEGLPIGTSEYTQIATFSFTLNATSALGTQLTIPRSTLSIGYFDEEDDANNNGIIEDNTGQVGDDVIPFETVQDLTIATATFDAGENWYLVGAPGAGASVDDLLGPLWTQGFAGSDAGTNGASNVVLWNETTGAYVTPTDQADALPAGRGAFVYVYADDDADGTPEAFPKTSVIAVDPVNDEGSPVNNTAPDPNPYQDDLPFGFSVTFTNSGSPDGNGWNLLSNPTDGTADWDDAGWVRTNMSTVLYTWDPDNPGGAQYVDWTPVPGSGTRGDGDLAPFEGFWSEATAASPVLTMPATAYQSAGGVVREAEAKAPAIELRVEGEVAGQSLANGAFVAFFDGADAGRDAYDAHELIGFTNPQLHLFSTLETGETFSTDVRPALDADGVELALDVSALADEAGGESTLTLTWPDLRGLDSSTPVQLVDLDTRTIVDLWAESSYTFSLAATSARAGLDKGDGTAASVLDGPLTMAGLAQRSTARTAADGRFRLFVGAQAQLPVAAEDEAPVAFGLQAPAPNPSRGRTLLRYALEEAGEARVAVYDMLGRAVTVAATGLHAVGLHDVALDTADLAPGLYVVRLEAEGRADTQSLTVVR